MAGGEGTVESREGSEDTDWRRASGGDASLSGALEMEGQLAPPANGVQCEACGELSATWWEHPAGKRLIPRRADLTPGASRASRKSGHAGGSEGGQECRRPVLGVRVTRSQERAQAGAHREGRCSACRRARSRPWLWGSRRGSRNWRWRQELRICPGAWSWPGRAIPDHSRDGRWEEWGRLRTSGCGWAPFL